jgi:transposase
MTWHKTDPCSPARSASDAEHENARPEMFRSGRQFAAWIGLTPKDHSTAGKVRLGVITRAGDEGLLAYWWSAQQPSSGISETPEAGAY